jgi:6-phosphofructokinase 1
MVAEGIGGVEALARRIEKECGVESRAIVLGHVQRGGSPTVRDRVAASQMGYKAVQLLMQGVGNRVVVQKDDHIIDYDIYEALNMERFVNDELYKIAHEISI